MHKGICTRESAQWNPQDVSCNGPDGDNSHDGYDGYDGYNCYRMMKSARENLLSEIQTALMAVIVTTPRKPQR